jgi:lipoic acid synthetase
MKVPNWITHRFPKPEVLQEITPFELPLHTVCEEARCPNIEECFCSGVATFLILGNICTRGCKFCGIKKGTPTSVNPYEPYRIAKVAQKLSLSYIVITSVTRDDLPDGGASQFIKTVIEIRKNKPSPTIELLLPLLTSKALKKIIAIEPQVIGHNIETVPRLYYKIRPKFRYSESIEFLGYIKKINPSITTKSGLMVGLGEKRAEVIKVMEDLRGAEVDILTIGQYLRPSGRHVPVKEYVHPTQFIEYKKMAYKLGFKYVASGVYVRSSYKAHEFLNKT